MTLPPDPIQAMPTYDLAKAAFEAQPSIRVLFDNGAGNSSNPGWPYPAFEHSFAAFPIPGTTARSWYLAPGGALADGPASGTRADAFTWDADARPLTDFTGDTGAGDNGLWTATPPYQWSQDPARHAVAYVTEPLSADTTVVGAGRVDLWVRSSAPNVDLQATISEVRPDGKETFVQNGWVRADARALDEAKSTELEPVLSLREADVAPMPSDQFVPVTVPLYYEGHAYRAGSRIRVRVSAPNGDQPIWSFSETEPAGTAEIEIGYGDGMPSRLVLPQVPGVDVPDQLPPCPGLRGEPCRDYVPFENATSVLDGYPRPRGATPLFIPLVPAYQSCSEPNTSHGAPLSFPSCNPSDLESQFLTVGTPDSNGKGAKSVGSVLFKVTPDDPVTEEDEADVRIAMSLTDVRRQADLDDYTRRARGRPEPADHRQAERRRGRRTGHGQRPRLPGDSSVRRDRGHDGRRDLRHHDDPGFGIAGDRERGKASGLGARPARGVRRRSRRPRVHRGQHGVCPAGHLRPVSVSFALRRAVGKPVASAA